jgi:hypothetical protein
MPGDARELLKQAAERIEEQAQHIRELEAKLEQYDNANVELAYEVDLAKKAFALVEYGIEPGYDSYNEALEKAASFEEQHGSGALSLNKQASVVVHREQPSLGKAAASPTVGKNSNSAEQRLLEDTLSIVNQEE